MFLREMPMKCGQKRGERNVGQGDCENLRTVEDDGPYKGASEGVDFRKSVTVRIYSVFCSVGTN